MERTEGNKIRTALDDLRKAEKTYQKDKNAKNLAAKRYARVVLDALQNGKPAPKPEDGVETKAAVTETSDETRATSDEL